VVLTFESRGDSNRCTPYRGKPDQHVTRFSRSIYVWSSIICIPRGPHIATFREVVYRVGQSHCSREKGILDYISSTSTDRSVGPHSVSLPLTTIEAVEKVTQLSTIGY
jgi:hypothetical protein